MTDEERIEERRHDLWIEWEAQRRHGQDVIAWRKKNGYGVGADVTKVEEILAQGDTHAVGGLG